MKIEFTAGAAGVGEVEALFHITLGARMDEFTERVSAALHDQAITCLSADGVHRARRHESLETNSLARRLFSKWQGFFGPSAREQELTHQRIEALERGAANLFEAVAKASQATRERDALGENSNRLGSAKP